MAGQRDAFETAMRVAAKAVWDQKWDKAIVAYKTAVGEFPTDINALGALGLALMEAKRFQEALGVYNRVTLASPDDLSALEKSADILERLGRLEEAGRKYTVIAEIYVAQHKIEQAIDFWERAVVLLPKGIRLRSRLAVVYEHTGQTKLAVNKYLALAGIFQRMSDLQKAALAFRYTLKLDPANDTVRSYMTALRQDTELELPTEAEQTQLTQVGFETFAMLPLAESKTTDSPADASKKVAGILKRIDGYIATGRLALAMEEAFCAVECTPWQVPLHKSIADILTKDRKTSAAADKYNMIALTLLVHGETEQAEDILSTILQGSPENVTARRRIIDLLIEQNRVPEALKHYEEMAEVCLTMANTEAARKAYQEAVALARQTSVEPEEIVKLLHKIGDLNVQRSDWQQALRSYEQVKAILPGDEKANLATLDLHFKLGQSRQAIKQLDDYLAYCTSSSRIDRVVSVLEKQMQNGADKIPLRQRLARIYQEQKRIPDAIAQMDALGKLFLEAGQQEEAIATIKEIVSLDPPDMEGYRQLLRKLE